MVQEGLGNGMEAVLNGNDEIRRHRKTRHHVFVNQSLMFQFLPLRHCEGPLTHLSSPTLIHPPLYSSLLSSSLLFSSQTNSKSSSPFIIHFSLF